MESGSRVGRKVAFICLLVVTAALLLTVMLLPVCHAHVAVTVSLSGEEMAHVSIYFNGGMVAEFENLGGDATFGIDRQVEFPWAFTGKSHLKVEVVGASDILGSLNTTQELEVAAGGSYAVNLTI